MGSGEADAVPTAAATPAVSSSSISVPADVDERLVELLPPEYTRQVVLVDFRAAVVPKAQGGELLKLLGSSSGAPLGPEYLHLKRVRPAPAPAPSGCLQVLICPASSDVPSEVQTFLTAKACGEPSIVQVPRDGALTRTQLAAFSAHWPLTFRKPSLEPLELPEARKSAYGRLLARALDVGRGRSACVIVDRSGHEVAAAAEDTAAHPLQHSVMVAIEQVAAGQRKAEQEELQKPGQKRARSEEEYLCQDYEVVTTHEPCVMCAMALVHSRVRLVAYRVQDPEFGGLGGKISLHTCQSLNHQFRVLRWTRDSE